MPQSAAAIRLYPATEFPVGETDLVLFQGRVRSMTINPASSNSRRFAGPGNRYSWPWFGTDRRLHPTIRTGCNTPAEENPGMPVPCE